MSESRGPAPTTREDLEAQAKELLVTLTPLASLLVYLGCLMDEGVSILRDTYHADKSFRERETDSHSFRMVADNHKQIGSFIAEMDIMLPDHDDPKTKPLSELIAKCERLYGFLDSYTLLAAKDRKNKKRND